MDELRVPKHAIAVELLLLGGTTRRVSVFVSDFASTHAGPERISDLLNQGGDFVPALDAEHNKMLFINRGQVAVAYVEQSLDADADSQHTIPVEYEVVVTLVDGQRIEGLVGYVLPPERERLIDFLNEPDAFFRLLVPGRVGLVNKHLVAQVEVLKR